MLLLTCSNKSYLPEMQIGCHALAENPPGLPGDKIQILYLSMQGLAVPSPRFFISPQSTVSIFTMSFDSPPRSSWARVTLI